MGFVAKAIGSVGKFLLGGGLIGSLFRKKPAQQALPGPVTRDDAVAEGEREDALRRRKGAAADMITGSGSGSRSGNLVVGS